MSKSGKSRRRIRSACIQELDSIEKGSMYLVLEIKNLNNEYNLCRKELTCNYTLSALISITSISTVISTHYYKGHSLQEVIKITI